MGQFDHKNYVLNVKVKENLTDTRAVERMKVWDFTLKEWDAFEKAISPFYNPYAERIIRFFVEYDKVDLCPDLYGLWEPLKGIFNKEDIRELSYRLAFPDATLFFKKRRRFDVVVDNLNYGLIFDPQNKYMVIPSKKKIGEYLGDIRIFINQNTKKFSFEQMQMIVDDMCEYLGTDYGVILNQENNEIIYQHK